MTRPIPATVRIGAAISTYRPIKEHSSKMDTELVKNVPMGTPVLLIISLVNMMRFVSLGAEVHPASVPMIV